MNTGIRLSIALLSRNRPDSLKRCLESLRAQDVSPHEIVVSDDSDPAHIESTRTIASAAGARWQEGPHRGLYANRNAAALACTGTHIRSMDDDHTFPPGHLACCLGAIARDPLAIWACDENGYLDGRLHAEHQAPAQLHPAGIGGPVADENDSWAIADGATIYPCEVFLRGHRMVEDFGYGSSYLEFGAFLYQLGWRSRLLRTTWIEHRAEAATIASGELRSRLFASLCFNLHFRPNPLLAVRYLGPQLVRRPALWRALPRLIRRAKERWSPLSSSAINRS